MKVLRLALSVVVITGLLVGYLSSQAAFFEKRTAEYAAKVDQPPIAMLALLVLVAAIVLSFVKDQESV